jgi:hypothetical protein
MWILIPVLIAVIAVALRFIPRAVVPPHLANHQVYARDDLIPMEMRKQLLDTVREMVTFGSNLETSKATGFVPTFEHIGEARPINPDGTCSHHLLLPNPSRTLCILPERMDVGKHFIMTGGLDGAKEPFDDMLSRVSSFARYTFQRDLDKFPVVKQLDLSLGRWGAFTCGLKIFAPCMTLEPSTMVPEPGFACTCDVGDEPE